MGQERRQFRRAPETFSAKCRLSGQLGEPWKEIKTVNISASGMRFIGDTLFDNGTPLELQITLPIGAETLIIPSITVWSKSCASGVIEVGIRFEELGQEKQYQIDQLVTFLSKGS